MKPKLDTTEYECAHGKKPRGFGNWLFAVETRDGRKDILGTRGLLSEAARTIIRDTRAVSIRVLP